MRKFIISIASSIRVLRVVVCMSLFAILVGCTDQAPRRGGDILVLGDSVMAWNSASNASIPDAMGRVLGRNVVSKAVPGAQFDNPSGIAGAVGFDIQRQLPPGRWNWVVINGGANDLGSDCGCGACGPVVDGLIGADNTSGSIPAFIQKVRGVTGDRNDRMLFAGDNTHPSAKGSALIGAYLAQHIRSREPRIESKR